MKNGLRAKDIKIIVWTLFIIVIVIFVANEILSGRLSIGDSDQSSVIKESKTLVNYSVETKSHIYTDNKTGYYMVNKDGISFNDFDNHSKMIFTYNFISPMHTYENNFVAVSEQKSNIIYVFDNKGLLYSVNTENPILSFSLNKLGYCSIIVSAGNDYKVLLFNNKGKSIGTYNQANKNTIPIASDISDDGRIMAVSITDYNGTNINSYINFFYTDKMEGLSFVDLKFDSMSKIENQLIYKLSFMNENKMVAFSDKEIICADLSSGFTEAWRVQLTNQVSHIDFDGGKGFVISLSDGLINKKSVTPGTAIYYDLMGDEVFTYASGGEVTTLSYSEKLNACIIGSDKEYTVLNRKGGIIWQFASPQTAENAIFYNTLDSYVMSFETYTAIYSKTTEQAKESITEPITESIIEPATDEISSDE